MYGGPGRFPAIRWNGQAMAQHKFQVGQNVALIPSGFFGVKLGPYKVLRILANDGIDWEYHVKHVGDGQERMVRQSEIFGEATPT